jgi:gliding motility-associated-like protein
MLKVKLFFYVIFSLTVLLQDKTYAQNIVSNGGFETDSVCPDDYGEIELATDWFSPTTGTPDYYYTCSHFRVTIPSNDFGTQATHSGNAYAGFGYYANTLTTHYSEYLQNKLTHTLLRGNTYYFRMYVSLGECSGKATNKIGVFFSRQKIASATSNYFIQDTPQIVTTNFITDKVNWTKVEGIFTAKGGEEFLTIGKFDSSSNSLTSVSGTWSVSNFPGGGYYYVDDVFLTDTCLISLQTNLLRSDTGICSNTTSMTLNANSTFDSPRFLWNTNDTTQSININHAGIYWVSVSNGSSALCIFRDTVSINDKSVKFSLGNDTTICSNNQITLIPHLSQSVNYLWQDNSTQNYLIANHSGTFWVKAFNGFCSSTDTINVSYAISPKILGNDFHICNDRIFPLKISANSSNADSYFWNNHSTDSFIVVNDSGLYWVSMSKNSCIISDSIRITKDLLVKPNLGPDTSVCNGSTLILNTHQTADFYSWYNLNTFLGATSSPFFNITSSGIYVVEANNSHNCRDRDTIIVNYSSKPVIDIGKDTLICHNTTIQLKPSFNINGLTYKWQNGDTSSFFNVSSAGIYWLEASNSGCKTIDSIKVNIENQLRMNLGNDTNLCQGQVLHLSVTTPGATNYLWSDHSLLNAINITNPGIYWSEVSKGYCKARDSINVTFSPIPVVNLGNDTIICANIILDIKPSTTFSSYLWNDGSVANHLSVTKAGKYWVKVSQNNCSSYDSIFVNTITPPSIHLGNDTNLCEGTTLLLQATVFGATYLWQNGSTASVYSVTSAGKYSVKVTKGICQVKDSVYITYTGKPNINLGNDTSYCFNQPVFLKVSTSADSYTWQDGSTNQTFETNNAGLYWVKVKKNGCDASDSISLFQKPFPIVNLGSDKNVCKEEEIILDAGNLGSIYLWNNQSTQKTNSVKGPGLFYVTVTNNIGCYRKDSIIIDTFPSTPVKFLKKATFCEGTNFLIDAGSQFRSYLWQDSSVEHYYNATKGGEYFVHLRDQNYCTSTDSIKLSELPKPELFLSKQLQICEPDTFIKPTGKFVSCLWEDGTTSLSHRITDYGTYSLTVTDKNQCMNSASIEVISNCPGNMYVPNAFTPNGDGNNDLFFPVTRNVKSLSWKIINRWGEVIFETSDFNKGWDGTFKNERVQADVYSYLVNYVGLDGKSYIKEGSITLLK